MSRDKLPNLFHRKSGALFRKEMAFAISFFLLSREVVFFEFGD
jgi:hypothetical protein